MCPVVKKGGGCTRFGYVQQVCNCRFLVDWQNGGNLLDRGAFSSTAYVVNKVSNISLNDRTGLK